MPVCSSWATADDLCAPCNDLYSADPYELDAKIAEASELLYELSAQQFPGTCELTVSPCSSFRFFDWRNWFIGNRSLFNTLGYFAACSCYSPAQCRCTVLPSIELPARNVTDVLQVEIDGYDLDPTAYELQENFLVRTDGEPWPCCTDDFTITFEHGLAPPSSGVTAAAVLGCELYLLCNPDISPGTCRLPRNVSQVARQGVSVIFQSITRTNRSQPFRFGITEIDLFLEAYAPYGQRARADIISPDTVPTGRRIP